MKLIQKTFDFFQSRSASDGGVSSVDKSDASLQAPASLSYLTTPVNEETALKFTAVFAAMRLRAEIIASLPKIVQKKEGGKFIDAADHPVYRLLKSAPNRYMNIFSFWEFVNYNLDGWGNAYVIIKRAKGGVPSALIPVRSSCVTVKFTGESKFYRISGTKYFDGTYDDFDMLHFYALSKDGITGLNPIIYNADAIGTGIETTKFGKEFFGKKGNLKGVMETDQSLSEQQYKNLQLQTSQNHGTPILEGGVKYKQLTMTPEAAQMLQTKTFSIQDIARIFNVPPHLLGDLSRSTFSNIEHQDIQFVKYALRATIKRYENELERKLFFDDEGNLEVKFNLEGLLRGDTAARSAYYSKAILNGWMSRNEIREIEGMNKIDGLDDFLYPGNELVVGKESKQ